MVEPCRYYVPTAEGSKRMIEQGGVVTGDFQFCHLHRDGTISVWAATSEIATVCIQVQGTLVLPISSHVVETNYIIFVIFISILMTSNIVKQEKSGEYLTLDPAFLKSLNKHLMLISIDYMKRLRMGTQCRAEKVLAHILDAKDRIALTGFMAEKSRTLFEAMSWLCKRRMENVCVLTLFGPFEPRHQVYAFHAMRLYEMYEEDSELFMEFITLNVSNSSKMFKMKQRIVEDAGIFRLDAGTVIFNLQDTWCFTKWVHVRVTGYVDIRWHEEEKKKKERVVNHAIAQSELADRLPDMSPQARCARSLCRTKCPTVAPLIEQAAIKHNENVAAKPYMPYAHTRMVRRMNELRHECLFSLKLWMDSNFSMDDGEECEPRQLWRCVAKATRLLTALRD